MDIKCVTFVHRLRSGLGAVKRGSIVSGSHCMRVSCAVAVLCLHPCCETGNGREVCASAVRKLVLHTK